MYRIILWGIGKEYRENISILRYIERSGDIRIVGVTASNVTKKSTLDGYRMFPPDVIGSIEYDYIFIMSEKFFNEIVNIVTSLNIDSKRCIPHSVLKIPFIDISKYLSLVDNPVSIISNNCWGGIVYNSLKLECLSPFKNLFVEDDDYLRLLSDLKYYLSVEPVFYKYADDAHNHETYPVLSLDGVMIHCNHDKEPQIAINNWKRRVEKVRFDNLFVEMYTDNRNIAGEFLKMNQYEKRYCLCPFKIDNNHSVELNLKENQELWEAVLATANASQPVFILQDLLKGNLVFHEQ